MSYSSVVSSNNITTRTALSTDGGLTWTFQSEVNQATPLSIACTTNGGQACSGNLVHEVSTILYDSIDSNTNARWKYYSFLFGTRAWRCNTIYTWYISLYTSSSLQGPWIESKRYGWNSTASAYSSTGVDQI